MGNLVHFEAEGADLFSATSLKKLWNHAAALGLAFDEFSIGNTRRNLGPQPLATITRWAAKPGRQILELRHSASDVLVYVTRFKGMQGDVKVRFRWDKRAPEPFLEWVMAFMNDWPFTSVKMQWDGGPSMYSSQDHIDRGWLLSLNDHQLRWLPEARLKSALAKTPGAFLRRGKRLTLVGLAAAPDAGLSKEQIEAAWAEIEQLAEEGVNNTLGTSFASAVEQALKPALTSLGFTLSPASKPREVHFVKGSQIVTARLLWLMSESSEPLVHLQASLPAARGGLYTLDLGDGPLDELKGVLDAGLERYTRDAPKWLANPGKFRPRR